MARVVIVTRRLTRLFPLRAGFINSLLRSRASHIHAVEDVSISVAAGSILGVVGESGCGKTTLGKLLSLLDRPTAGEISFHGVPVTSLRGRELKAFRRKVQMIFQDPYESLNPRQTVYETVVEPLSVQRVFSRPRDYGEAVAETLQFVGLTPPRAFRNRYPHELSGGQRQRVAIARALVLKPSFVIADEPVSMIDVSVRVGILDLMLKWRDTASASFVFITHDIALARYMSNQLVVMYLGQIVESGPTEEVIGEPLHPYTRELMRAVPVPDPTFRRVRASLRGSVTNPIDPAPMCRFAPRCPEAKAWCRQEMPLEYQVDRQRRVRCFLYRTPDEGRTAP